MTVSDEMTCEEFTEMAPAYALAVLDEMERTACTRHLAQRGPHRGCQEAVGEARQVTACLAAAVPARPPSPGETAGAEGCDEQQALQDRGAGARNF